jgi:hypothetical protein
MPDEVVRALTSSLHIAEALAMAAERASEIFDLLYSSDDPDDPDAAVARLMRERGLDKVQAAAILATEGGKYTVKGARADSAPGRAFAESASTTWRVTSVRPDSTSGSPEAERVRRGPPGRAHPGARMGHSACVPNKGTT